jgi:hypothetical protein
MDKKKKTPKMTSRKALKRWKMKIGYMSYCGSLGRADRLKAPRAVRK